MSTALLVIVHPQVDCSCGHLHTCHKFGRFGFFRVCHKQLVVLPTQPLDWQDCAVHCCRHHSQYETLNLSENETLNPCVRQWVGALSQPAYICMAVNDDMIRVSSSQNLVAALLQRLACEAIRNSFFCSAVLYMDCTVVFLIIASWPCGLNFYN